MIRFIIFSLFPLLAFAQTYIDLDKTLFGIEYSFQDQIMVNEPGRNTLSTPHKSKKVAEMAGHFANLMQLPASAVTVKTTWKPGLHIQVPGEGQYVINSEPVTIEFNTTPKRYSEILRAATPIYLAASKARLVPYVNPAAERSGMGHIHVGGRTLQESPFFQNENLLRNIYAYFHKHPSLLYGFAEAYDLGKRSNIETLHEPAIQSALAQIFSQYDSIVSQPRSKRSNGLLELINLFKTTAGKLPWTADMGFIGWFAHYRFINLEHLEKLRLDSNPAVEGKQTVEFRAFRPPKSPQHAQAMAGLLVAAMDHLAKPNHLEPFQMIEPKRFATFKTGTAVASDWEIVKRELGINDQYLDSMIAEFVSNVHKKTIPSPRPGVEIFESYSEKELKGKHFEIRIDAAISPMPPQIELFRDQIHFEKVTYNKKQYWVGLADLKSNPVNLIEFRRNPGRFLINSTKLCRAVIKEAS